MSTPSTARTAGFWLLMAWALFLLIMVLAGQTMALIDYELTVSMGLQEPAGQVTAVGVAMNKGYGVADTLIYAPFLAGGLLGLPLRRRWGVLSMFAAAAITAYWPVAALSTVLFAKGAPGFALPDTTVTAYTFLLITISATGLFACRYLYAHASQLASD